MTVTAAELQSRLERLARHDAERDGVTEAEAMAQLLETELGRSVYSSYLDAQTREAQQRLTPNVGNDIYELRKAEGDAWSRILDNARQRFPDLPRYLAIQRFLDTEDGKELYQNYRAATR